MKNKNLIYIIVLLLFVAPACRKHKASVDGFVRDVGTQKTLGGLFVYVMKTDGIREYGAGEAHTDASGYFKCNFEIQNGYTYQLRCSDPNKTTWYWVDVNQKPNPLGVRNSGEDLTKEKIQHQDMWMGRYTEFDSLIFYTDIPFLKGDEINIEITDSFKSLSHSDYIKPGSFRYLGFDTLYQFDFTGEKKVLANSRFSLYRISGTKNGMPYYYSDTIMFPLDAKLKTIKKIN